MTSRPNAYATSVTQSTACEAPSLERLLLVNNQTNVGGRLWTSCRHALYSDRLELTFLTQSFCLPVDHIQALKSGRQGWNRYLEIIHDDPLVPDTLRMLPKYPAKWFDAFESLGISTEDDAELRDSKQLLQRSADWTSMVEGGFWMLVLLSAVVLEIVSRLIGR